jgi:hypothetical protein
MTTKNAPRRQTSLARPAARWGVLAAAVAVAHGLIFWAVADKHFLPKALRFGSSAPPPRADFTARERKVIDPRTGRETAILREFNVSTRLAAPTAPAPPSGASK